jgi:hypothetical protein
VAVNSMDWLLTSSLLWIMASQRLMAKNPSSSMSLAILTETGAITNSVIWISIEYLRLKLQPRST